MSKPPPRRVVTPTSGVMPPAASPPAARAVESPPKPRVVEAQPLTPRPSAPPSRHITTNEQHPGRFGPPPPRRVQVTTTRVETITGQPEPRRAVQTAQNPAAQVTASIAQIRLNELLRVAKTLSPELSANVRFAQRLKTIAVLPKTEWINVGKRALDELRPSHTEYGTLAQQYKQLDTTKWINETNEQAAKPPGMFNKIMKAKPEYYETRLDGIRTELEVITRRAGALRTGLTDRVDTLQLDSLALQAVSQSETDPTLASVVGNRVKLLLASAQTAMLLDQEAQQLILAITTHISTIDQLLQIKIPNWKLANQRA